MELTVSLKFLTAIRQKRAIFNVNRQETQLLFAIKRCEGPLKITISAADIGLQALKKSF